MSKLSISLLFFTLVLCAQEYYEGGKKVKLTPLSSAPACSSSITATLTTSHTTEPQNVQWYRTEQGHTIGVLQEILIVWANPALKEAVLAHFPVITQEDLSATITLITIGPSEDVFFLSQKLYEDPATKAAHPNLIKEKVYR